ncbi:DUF6894 family protein [Methylobacterium haplocladii]|uniref:DUF6894 domain-containing protein n=1 Tax=Methylobacterium haplocladii TaxID=1176176 RepID=A0A512IQE6_9HYPH|nr:hypothetical protein [Methylobacterium haplocladii]GEO99943.1 hypothetical protein MHA02_23310 [Methylobacterium haplocladii]GJD86212.1 hypothetical protein HPGCJGGD_4111 [Methylobacterium haplocladii]GLS59657.1 hypothetical protein GCM10007887_23260 [Methylobacterium haplocladii]
MPRYYFDIDRGYSLIDNSGMVLHDGKHAHHEALQRAAEFACDANNLRSPGAIVVTVRDGPQSILLTVRLVCVVEGQDLPLGASAP